MEVLYEGTSSLAAKGQLKSRDKLILLACLVA